MHIEYIHASKFGNGLQVAERFRQVMSESGSTVQLHHVRSVDPRHLDRADVYVFSSPGRMGRPLRAVRRFLAAIALPAGTEYGLLTTEATVQAPPTTTGGSGSEEPDPHQRVRPAMHEILQGKGLIPLAEQAIVVSGTKGPLQSGWEQDVAAFAERLTRSR